MSSEKEQGENMPQEQLFSQQSNVTFVPLKNDLKQQEINPEQLTVVGKRKMNQYAQQQIQKEQESKNQVQEQKNDKKQNQPQQQQHTDKLAKKEDPTPNKEDQGQGSQSQQQQQNKQQQQQQQQNEGKKSEQKHATFLDIIRNALKKMQTPERIRSAIDQGQESGKGSFNMYEDSKILEFLERTKGQNQVYKKMSEQRIINRTEQSIRSRFEGFLKKLRREDMIKIISHIQKTDSLEGYLLFQKGEDGERRLAEITLEDPKYFHSSKQSASKKSVQKQQQQQKENLQKQKKLLQQQQQQIEKMQQQKSQSQLQLQAQKIQQIQQMRQQQQQQQQQQHMKQNEFANKKRKVSTEIVVSKPQQEQQQQQMKQFGKNVIQSLQQQKRTPTLGDLRKANKRLNSVDRSSSEESYEVCESEDDDEEEEIIKITQENLKSMDSKKVQKLKEKLFQQQQNLKKQELLINQQLARDKFRNQALTPSKAFLRVPVVDENTAARSVSNASPRSDHKKSVNPLFSYPHQAQATSFYPPHQSYYPQYPYYHPQYPPPFAPQPYPYEDRDDMSDNVSHSCIDQFERRPSQPPYQQHYPPFPNMMYPPPHPHYQQHYPPYGYQYSQNQYRQNPYQQQYDAYYGYPPRQQHPNATPFRAYQHPMDVFYPQQEQQEQQQQQLQQEEYPKFTTMASPVRVKRSQMHTAQVTPQKKTQQGLVSPVQNRNQKQSKQGTATKKPIVISAQDEEQYIEIDEEIQQNKIVEIQESEDDKDVQEEAEKNIEIEQENEQKNQQQLVLESDKILPEEIPNILQCISQWKNIAPSEYLTLLDQASGDFKVVDEFLLNKNDKKGLLWQSEEDEMLTSVKSKDDAVFKWLLQFKGLKSVQNRVAFMKFQLPFSIQEQLNY